MPEVFKTCSEFSHDNDYAIYIRNNIQVGMTVRCCKKYEEVQEGDIGRVFRVC